MIDTKNAPLGRELWVGPQFENPLDRRMRASVDLASLSTTQTQKRVARESIERLGATAGGNGNAGDSLERHGAGKITLVKTAQKHDRYEGDDAERHQRGKPVGKLLQAIFLRTELERRVPKCRRSPSETNAQDKYGSIHPGLRTTCKTVPLSSGANDAW